MKIVLPEFPFFRLINNPWTWLKIVLLAALIAIGAAAWPTAQCAWGACDVKDTWCNGDCSQACGPTNGLGIIRDNQSGVPACELNSAGNYCVENWYPDYVGVRCTNASDCNVTQLANHPEESDRLYTSGGNSFWYVGKCTRSAGTCSYQRQDSPTKVTCCVAAAGGGGGGGACTPTYAPPAISLAGYSPKNPLVYGQDPDQLGLDVTISVSGGNKTNSCSDGPAQRAVTSINVNGVSLSAASVEWISGPLALRYPGAYVKGSYPGHPAVTTSGLMTTSAQAAFHIDPLDPGVYEISVTAIQDDGQTSTLTLNVPASLLDTTITLPVQP